MNKFSACLTQSDLPWPGKKTGKVRDVYDLGNYLAMVTTDRQSAFDRYCCAVPHKGQVLNLCSAWWFRKTYPIVANHVVDVPDPNVIIAKKCRVFPVEFVVRGYLTGSTNTSIWTQYQQGKRRFGGITLPEGMKKNDPLPQPIITPTTKSDDHDMAIEAEAVIAQGFMTEAQWQEAANAVLALFEFGNELAREKGLILVDSKYELGLDSVDQLTLVDELHTPDSSRYWRATSYEHRHQQGQEPESFDKENLRLWLTEHGDPYRDAELPEIPDAVVDHLSNQYVGLYESITGEAFNFPVAGVDFNSRMLANINRFMQSITL